MSQTPEEKLENAVDVVRDVMHKWHHFHSLAEKARAVKGVMPNAEATAIVLEGKAEEHWRRIRPALRKLQGGD